MSLTRRFHRRLQRKKSAAKKHRKVHFEALEPRILLSNPKYRLPAGLKCRVTFHPK